MELRLVAFRTSSLSAESPDSGRQSHRGEHLWRPNQGLTATNLSSGITRTFAATHCFWLAYFGAQFGGPESGRFGWTSVARTAGFPLFLAGFWAPQREKIGFIGQRVFTAGSNFWDFHHIRNKRSRYSKSAWPTRFSASIPRRPAVY